MPDCDYILKALTIIGILSFIFLCVLAVARQNEPYRRPPKEQINNGIWVRLEGYDSPVKVIDHGFPYGIHDEYFHGDILLKGANGKTKEGLFCFDKVEEIIVDPEEVAALEAKYNKY